MEKSIGNIGKALKSLCRSALFFFVMSLGAQEIHLSQTSNDLAAQAKLETILQASGWFVHPSVEVKQGIAFLYGETQTEDTKTWAETLAKNTAHVDAVVNKITLIHPSFWELRLDWHVLQLRGRQLMLAIPSILLGLVILFLAWGLAKFSRGVCLVFLTRKLGDTLLKEVVLKTIQVMIFLFGVYLIFEMAGLTNAALTIVSGTGVLGIILGIAFRDITENFLASILLSVQNPFRHGDLIEIGEVKGYVQKLTMRATLLMSLEGTQIQVPNATVYKSNIRNLTCNPIRREDFVIGIGFQESISKVQELILQALKAHDAPLKSPEPSVLVDQFGKSSIELKVYFWFNVAEYSPQKIKSSIMRLVKRTLQEAHISIPDEGRELLFPQALAVQIVETTKGDVQSRSAECATSVTGAETSLRSDAKNIEVLAERSKRPEDGKNILSPHSDSKQN